jgi:pimeloyl-ACP methyl ester carboxylesterase
MPTFTGFRERRVPVHSDIVGDIEIYAKVGGSGPGLLLIHGYPQCHQCVLPPLLLHPLWLVRSLTTFL